MKENFLLRAADVDASPAPSPRGLLRLREYLRRLSARLARRLDRMAATLEYGLLLDDAPSEAPREFARRPGDPVGAVYLDGERLGALPREVRRL